MIGADSKKGQSSKLYWENYKKLKKIYSAKEYIDWIHRLDRFWPKHYCGILFWHLRQISNLNILGFFVFELRRIKKEWFLCFCILKVLFVISQQICLMGNLHIIFKNSIVIFLYLRSVKDSIIWTNNLLHWKIIF